MAYLPKVIVDKSTMREWSRTQKSVGKTVALVPTMGFLHEGYISLIQEAKHHSTAIVVSIYVNPGQFAPSEDLSVYPRDPEGDLRKLEEVGGVSAVFCPTNLYDTGDKGGNFEEGKVEEKAGLCCLEDGGHSKHETWVRVERLEKGLCGTSRPVFFRGVATVVAKLFNVVEPDVAVFGKKDYQQWRIIRRMVLDLDFPIKIIGSDIVREDDGLAMSSRNVRLSSEQRQKVVESFYITLSIYRSMSEARIAAKNGQDSPKELINSISEKIVEAGGRIDYVEIVDQENLERVQKINRPVVICVAAWFGTVRLIDNMEIDILK